MSDRTEMRDPTGRFTLGPEYAPPNKNRFIVEVPDKVRHRSLEPRRRHRHDCPLHVGHVEVRAARGRHGGAAPGTRRRDRRHGRGNEAVKSGQIPQGWDDNTANTQPR